MTDQHFSVKQTAEVRWFLGQSLALDRWDISYAARPVRHDFYLRGSGERLGVKWREGNIEIKQQQGKAEVYQHRKLVGYLEQWKKWSFPLADKEAFEPTDHWIKVIKQRCLARFSYQAGTHTVIPIAADDSTTDLCELEYTHLVVAGQDYYTVGVEASGDVTRLTENLVATMRYLAENSNLGESWLVLANSSNYARWLHHHFTCTT